MARRTPGRCRYRRRPLVAALPPPAWGLHARPGPDNDDESAATFSLPTPVDCEGKP